MLKTKSLVLSLLASVLLFAPMTASAQSDSTHRAVLLNPVYGHISPDQPQNVRFKVTQGPASGCIVKAKAYLNPKRLRYEYELEPTHCVKNGQNIAVGNVVRGQHNIKGTMANSGMGRSYLTTRKGVTVTLSNH